MIESPNLPVILDGNDSSIPCTLPGIEPIPNSNATAARVWSRVTNPSPLSTTSIGSP